MQQNTQPQQQQSQKPTATTNIFPSAVFANSIKSTVSVELRSGVTLIGVLQKADSWMNLVLQNAQRYSPDGSIVVKSGEIVVRGNSVRSVRVTSDSVRPREQKQQQQQKKPQFRQNQQNKKPQQQQQQQQNRSQSQNQKKPHHQARRRDRD